MSAEPMIPAPLDNPVFGHIRETVDRLGVEAYVVGGFVRDYYLRRPSTDIDVVVVGDGVAVAEDLGRKLRAKVSIFKTFGTAMLRWQGTEVEFVGARRESYSHDSRKPQVEPGTLEDDKRRRDFTINAMAWSLNSATFGRLVDPFDGMYDLEECTIRTPCDPDITFSDDPLRMMRAIRFATQLGFTIHPDTFEAIKRNAARIEIITPERISTELEKIMLSPKPSIGWDLLHKSGLLKLIFPELEAMAGVQVMRGRGHKDNFYHTLEVLDNVAEKSDKLWLRWAALLHDIAKPVTKRWDDKLGWTVHNHTFVGSNMGPAIFRRLKLVELHMRPMTLVEDEITDSAVRRLIHYAEDDLADLMILARADITSKNMAKKQLFLANFDIVEQKFADILTKDEDAKFRPALDGKDIMRIFGLGQCPLVGRLMKPMTAAAKDCTIDNTREACLAFLLDLAPSLGLAPVDPTA